MAPEERVKILLADAIIATDVATSAHQGTLDLLYGLVHGDLNPADYVIRPEGWGKMPPKPPMAVVPAGETENEARAQDDAPCSDCPDEDAVTDLDPAVITPIHRAPDPASLESDDVSD